MYRTLFYVNIYGSYKLSKNSSVFLAHDIMRYVGLQSKHSIYIDRNE